jgi:ribose 5-phosphate isomerase A
VTPQGVGSETFEAAIAAVGRFAAERIRPGMRLGLGTGRTATAFLDALEPRLTGDLPLVAVCTSKRTEERARAMGITILESTEEPLDLDIDGADEIDPQLNLIKGAGGAMVREKIVAERSRRFWVVADSGKLVARLGERQPLPLEVLPFDWRGTAARVRAVSGGTPCLRGGDQPFVTDNGNYVLDLQLPPAAPEPTRLARQLEAIPGVLGHGLFLQTATAAIVSDGRSVEVRGDLDRVRPGI